MVFKDESCMSYNYYTGTEHRVQGFVYNDVYLESTGIPNASKAPRNSSPSGFLVAIICHKKLTGSLNSPQVVE